MPDGKTHDRLWKKYRYTSYLLSVLSYILCEITVSYIIPFSCTTIICFPTSWIIGAGVITGYLLGKFITPDLDMPGITQNEWDAMRKGKLLGALFVSYWMPYAYMIKHRAFWSHSYIFSSLLRVIYAFWWIPVVIKGSISWTILFGTFIGLSASDAVHIYADFSKRRKNVE